MSLVWPNVIPSIKAGEENAELGAGNYRVSHCLYEALDLFIMKHYYLLYYDCSSGEADTCWQLLQYAVHYANTAIFL